MQGEPWRPVIEGQYTPGDGSIAECRAIGPTHVVVKWLKPSTHRPEGELRPVIYTREAFAAQFAEVPIHRVQQLELSLDG